MTITDNGTVSPSPSLSQLLRPSPLDAILVDVLVVAEMPIAPSRRLLMS